MEWQQAAVLKYESKVLCGALTLAGCPASAYGGLTEEGRSRLGYVVGILPSSLWGYVGVAAWNMWRRLLLRPSKFTRKLVKGSLGGEAYAVGGVTGHMATLREFFAPFADVPPGVAGSGDCESLSIHLNRRMISGNYLARLFPSAETAILQGELTNSFWRPGQENPADGLTKSRYVLVPLLNLLEAGASCPSAIRPFKGLATREFPGE